MSEREAIKQEMPLVLPDDDGIRPAGAPDECFYCMRKVGEPHWDECVCLEKKVYLRYSFEIEVNVPWSWDESQILHHRNNSSWCADNALEELSIEMKKRGCLCGVFEAQVIGMSYSTPFRKNKNGDVVE